MGVRVPPSAFLLWSFYKVHILQSPQYSFSTHSCAREPSMNIQSRLGGGKFGDPSLYINIVDRKCGLLFDCGLNSFRHASLRKVSDVFISHAHIDHFIGFDTLLRLNLSEDKTLHVYGPPGICRNVAGKLQGYTWNICQTLQLRIIVHEVRPEALVSTRFDSWRGFATPQTTERPPSEVLLQTADFQVSYLPLNHKTPSFGYCFLETDSFNVQKEALAAFGLTPGPWVAALKTQALDPDAHSTPLQVGDQTYTIGWLSQQLLVRKPGIKLTYLTDFRLDDAQLDQIAAFARASDLLYCESAFMEHDRDKAHRTFHLTAREAGLLARAAEAKRLVIFHFSRRYQDVSLLLDEAKTEFPHVE